MASLIAPWLAQKNKEPAQTAGPQAAEWTEITRVIEDSLAKSAFNEFRQKPDGHLLKVFGSTAVLLKSSSYLTLRFAVL